MSGYERGFALVTGGKDQKYHYVTFHIVICLFDYIIVIWVNMSYTVPRVKDRKMVCQGGNVVNEQEFIQQEFYRFIFEKSLDAILLTSPDGPIHRANPAACAMFQRTEEEIIQAGRAGIVDLKDPRLEPALQERREKGSVVAELTFYKKDGSRFPGQVSSTIFQDNHGREWTAMIVRDITELRQTEEILKELQQATEEMARRDFLTGVWNRRGFIDKLRKETSRAHRKKGPLSLMLLDIDHFKSINDQYGHLCGDVFLSEFALKLTSMLRPYDEIGRYGGDEFILLLPDTDKEEACRVAERIRLEFKEHPVLVKGKKISTTMSIGVMELDGGEEKLNDIISRVDGYMYNAKKLRDCVYSG